MKKNVTLIILCCSVLFATNLSYASDASDDTLCFKWPRIECAGGDIYFVVDYIGSPSAETMGKINRILKKSTSKSLDKWNKKTSHEYNFYWMGSGGNSDLEKTYLVRIEVNSNYDDWQNKIVFSSVIYSYDNGKWDSSGPLFIHNIKQNDEALDRYFDCHIAANFYKQEYFKYIRDNKIRVKEYCDNKFLMRD